MPARIKEASPQPCCWPSAVLSVSSLSSAPCRRGISVKIRELGIDHINNGENLITSFCFPPWWSMVVCYVGKSMLAGERASHGGQLAESKR